MKIPDQMKIVLHKEIALMHYQFMMERVCKVLLLGITIHGRRLRGGGVLLGAIDPLPFACFALFIYYKKFNISLNFFNETFTLFLKQLKVNFKNQ